MVNKISKSNWFKPSTRLVIALFVVYVSSLVGVQAGFFGGGGGGAVNNEELYRLLGVSKTASTKEIRIAFKKLALEKHPDKNPDDPKANEEFVKINRAYETLKDEELRKKYDQFGEEGLKDNFNSGSNYQSWHFYNSNFGIYDDDPDVITLSRSDFMQTVEGSDTIWFINFYSAQCSHCHDLAPTWRELAKQLSGVVKIGAINCMDDWMLCNEQFIQAFPSLVIYPKKLKYNEAKTLDALLKFALSFAQGRIYDLSDHALYVNQLGKKEQKPWLVSYCLSSDSSSSSGEADVELNYELNCLDESIQQKLAIMLNGLAKVGSIDCTRKETRDRICNKLKPSRAAPLVYYAQLPNITKQIGGEQTSEPAPAALGTELHTTDYKQIAQYILSLMPDIRVLDHEAFAKVLADLRDPKSEERPWLIQFVYTYDTINDIELKKLPYLLAPNFNFGRVDCSQMPNQECTRYQLAKYPTYILFKSAASVLGNVAMKDNWYDVHYGNRQSPEDLVAFVKENAYTPVRTLTEFDMAELGKHLSEQNKLGFFIDFFAPWCPPCMNLLPEFRKASKLDDSQSISFGTVDCTMNQNLCAQHGVRSYPTTILFNNTTPHNYHGQHKAADIADFIQDILKPSLISLNYESFHRLVAKKPVGEIWFITFSASWCGPCQQLAPEWRKLAKKIDKKLANVASVDCAVEQMLCSEQHVTSYPNIRVYTANSYGVSSFEMYNGWMRDVNSLMQWAGNYLPSKSQHLDYRAFERMIVNQSPDENEPWLVDFYSPWCGHCHVFAPIFESIAFKLDGRVKCAKVNCQEQQHICQMIGIRAFPTVLFFTIPKPNEQNSNNWRPGEEIRSHEERDIISEVESKLKKYGYASKKSSKANDEL